MAAERERLAQADGEDARWRLWGPYLTEREWGTVREDYSATGEAWDYFTHDQARSRAYRWAEDGLLGISDHRNMLCFALGLWNGQDAILKERLFGLTNSQGNHGEDVKECYYYQDATPTHSYLKATYLYPHKAYPYAQLEHENRVRGKDQPEFELWHTGVLDENRYFEVVAEYAKFGPEDIGIRITIKNRGPEAASCTLLPQLWLRKRFPWVLHSERKEMWLEKDAIRSEHPEEGDYFLSAEGNPQAIFSENECNNEKLFGTPSISKYVKDAFHHYVVNGEHQAVNPQQRGTKAAYIYHLNLEPGSTEVIRLRLRVGNAIAVSAKEIDDLFASRIAEADEFYAEICPDSNGFMPALQRQAFAGLIWSKQYYHLNMRRWCDGDPGEPPPPPQRMGSRNKGWDHFRAAEVISMPDAWEYPWFASWDLGFHCIPFTLIDPAFAKDQLLLLLREWYMHPNGQIPAYEWAFSDANPPVQAWAAWRIYSIDRRLTGKGDRAFLERVFHKLLLNFTWWVNRKDLEGNNVFEGGFLGLDNIGVFDRNIKLPDGFRVEESDGTSWMAAYSLSLAKIALELAVEEPVYEDIATKFLEHFLFISNAMNEMGSMETDLWNEEDGFYYDLLCGPGHASHLKVRSWVGLIPLFATQTVDQDALDMFPNFKNRIETFLRLSEEMTQKVANLTTPGVDGRRLFALVNRERLERILQRLFDTEEFLSPYGIRGISKVYEDNPYEVEVAGTLYRIDYEPGESTSGAFGGNSNWRGPIWMPLNFALIEALQKLDYYYGESLKLEVPARSGNWMTLWDASIELERRLLSIFEPGEDGVPPAMRDNGPLGFGTLYHEYFHAETGRGLGASHQTGWTALVAKMVDQVGRLDPKMPKAK